MFLLLVTRERGCEELLFRELEVSHFRFLVLYVRLLAHRLVFTVCTYSNNCDPFSVLCHRRCVTASGLRHKQTWLGALSVDDSGDMRMSPLRLLHLNPPNYGRSSPSPLYLHDNMGFEAM